MRKILLMMILLALTLTAVSAFAGTISGSLSFSNAALLRPEGESEPAIGFASDGTMAVTGLQWLFDPNFFGTPFVGRTVWLNPNIRGLTGLGAAAARQNRIWQRRR